MNTWSIRQLGLMAYFLTACSFAFARGETSDESALATFESRFAPIALSANGQWRVHVDSKNILHRVNLLDVRQAQQIALPVEALQLAASRTARKVAFAYMDGCVGIVDFGNPMLSTPKLTWISRAESDKPGRSANFDSKVPDAKSCSEYRGRGAIAISTDGKLVANENGIYDLGSQTVVATLPSSRDDIAQRRTLSIQFTDNNKKLFLATATLGDGYEGGGGPSDMQFSIWDIASKALFNLAGGSRHSQHAPEMFIYNYAAHTGALSFVDSTRYYEVLNKQSEDSDTTPTLDLIRTNLHTCQAKTHRRMALLPGNWVAYAVDPLGRWIAGVRTLGGTGIPSTRGRGFVEELVIVDASSGTEIKVKPLIESVMGMVVTPDGTSIFGLTPVPINSHTGSKFLGSGVELLQFKIPRAALNLPKSEALGFSSMPCKIEDETASARLIHKTRRLLKPRWTFQVKSPEDIRNAAEQDHANKNKLKATDAGPALCNSIGYDNASLIMANQTLWLDKYSELAQLDWTTGKAIRSMPTPRKRAVCSVAIPLAGGFINYQGDAVTFQNFEGVSGPKASKQVIEVKPGWYVDSVSQPIVSTNGQLGFEVIWRTKPGIVPAKNEHGQVLDMIASTYVLRTKVRTNEVKLNSDSYEMGGYEGEVNRAPGQGRPSCGANKPAGSLAFGMEVSYFDSFRAYRCNAANEVETIFWDGLDIAPQRVGFSWYPRAQFLAVSGTIGVVQSRSGLVRIYDLAARKELAQIKPSSFDAVLRVMVNESKGLVAIESLDEIDGEQQRNLTAYSYR